MLIGAPKTNTVKLTACILFFFFVPKRAVELEPRGATPQQPVAKLTTCTVFLAQVIWHFQVPKQAQGSASKGLCCEPPQHPSPVLAAPPAQLGTWTAGSTEGSLLLWLVTLQLTSPDVDNAFALHRESLSGFAPFFKGAGGHKVMANGSGV